MKNLGQVKNNKDIVTKQYTDDGLDKKANTNHRHNNATSALDGFMSAGNFKKLDSVAYGATKVIVDDDFDENSINALQNKKITNKFEQVDDILSDHDTDINNIKNNSLRDVIIPKNGTVNLNDLINEEVRDSDGNIIKKAQEPTSSVFDMFELSKLASRKYYYDPKNFPATSFLNFPSIFSGDASFNYSFIIDSELIPGPAKNTYSIRQILTARINSYGSILVFDRKYFNEYSKPKQGTWSNWREITTYKVDIIDNEDLQIQKDYTNSILNLKHSSYLSSESNIGKYDSTKSITVGSNFSLPWFTVNKQGHIIQTGNQNYKINNINNLDLSYSQSGTYYPVLANMSDEQKTSIATENCSLYRSVNFAFNLANGTLSCNKFSGDGSSITNLNASNIKSGVLDPERLSTAGINNSGEFGKNTIPQLSLSSPKFNIPHITVDTKGRVTSISDTEMKLPNAAFSDQNVAQLYIKDSSITQFNKNLRILLSDPPENPDGENIKDFIGDTKFHKITYNPYSETLSTENINTGTINLSYSQSGTYYPVLANMSDEQKTSTATENCSLYRSVNFAFNLSNGTLSCSKFSGSGEGISNLNASNIKSGVLDPERLSTAGINNSGKFGPSDSSLGSDSRTLKVPYITIDTKGRVTNATTQTIKLHEDSMVQQFLDNTSNKKYRLLLSHSDINNYSETGISRKSDNLTYNPSTNTLSVGNITTTGTITSRGLQCNGDLSVSGISAAQIKTTGLISGSTISGSGAGITNLDASNIKLGTLSKDIIIEGNAATATKATTATSLETAININGISFDGSSNVINYGVCHSSESATEKVVACPGFTLINGAMITVYFSKSNTVDQPTLNVNSTGAKNIINKGFSNVFKNYFKSGRVFTFIYISGSYHIIGGEEFNLNSLVVAGSSTGTTTTTTALNNSQVHLNMIEDGKVKSSFLISGQGQTSVTADSTGNISVKTSITSLPNPNSLTIQANGTTLTAYNGSFARTVNITGSGATTVTTDTDGVITISSKDTKYTHPSYTAKSSGLYKVTVDSTGHVSAATAVTKSDITALGIPSSNTDTKVTSAAVNPSSATTYYPTLVTGATTGTVSYNTDLNASILQGTTSTEGYAVLTLGNNTAKGTTGNKKGQINLYSSSTACSYIRQADITSAITHTFPATGGTVLNSGTTSFSPSITSGSTSGTLKINGNSYNVYFTDTKVTQTNTTASSAYRLLMSYDANDTTQTVGARKSVNFTANPSTGCLTAKMFKGAYITIYSGTIAASSGTITISNLWNYSILFVSVTNINGTLAKADRYPIAVQNLNASTSNMEVIHFFESDGTYSTSTANFIRFKKSSTANSIDITTEGIQTIGMIKIEAFL